MVHLAGCLEEGAEHGSHFITAHSEKEAQIYPWNDNGRLKKEERSYSLHSITHTESRAKRSHCTNCDKPSSLVCGWPKEHPGDFFFPLCIYAPVFF